MATKVKVSKKVNKKIKSTKKISKTQLLELKKSEKQVISRLVKSAFTKKNKKRDQALITDNFPLAVHVAKKYFNKRSDTYRDLIQVAAIGLIKAAKNFDPKIKVSFASYAIPTIEGEIKHYLRDTAYMIKIPRKYSELGIRLEKYRKEFLYKNGREITNRELSKALKVKIKEIEKAKETIIAHYIVSFETPIYSNSNSRGRDAMTTLENILGQESNINKMIEREGLLEAMATLNKRDSIIVKDHFIREMKQDMIALKHEITQAQVSRILKRSCKKMREIMV